MAPNLMITSRMTILDHQPQPQHDTQPTGGEYLPETTTTSTTIQQQEREERDAEYYYYSAAGAPPTVATCTSSSSTTTGTTLIRSSTTKEEQDHDDGHHDQQHQHDQHHPQAHHHKNNRRSSSSSSYSRALFLHTIPEDTEWFEDDDASTTSSCSSSTTSSSLALVLPDGLAWVGILRNDILLMDIGLDHVPESVPATARALLGSLEQNNSNTKVGWDRVVVSMEDEEDDGNNDNNNNNDDPAAIVGLRFHVLDDSAHAKEDPNSNSSSTTTTQETHGRPFLTVWTFACVYNGRNLTERQAQWFVQEHLVRATHTVRAIDPAWRHGDHHAVQALWAPLLQEKIQDYESSAVVHHNSRHRNHNNHHNPYTRSKLNGNHNNNKQSSSGGDEPNLDYCLRIIQQNRRLVLQGHGSRPAEEWDESDPEDEENGSDDDEYDSSWTPALPLEEEEDDDNASSDWLANVLPLLSKTDAAASSSPHNNNNNYNSTGKDDTKPTPLSSNPRGTMVQPNINRHNEEMEEVKLQVLTVVAADDETEDLTITTMLDDNTNHLEENDVAVMYHLGTFPILESPTEKGPPASSPTSVLVARLAPEAPRAKSTTKKARAVTDDDDDHRPCFFCFSFWAPKQPAFIEYNQLSSEHK